MSGFEVAGIVLGAFPILLSALEGYRALARTAGLWSNIRSEHQKCKNEVNAQRVAFVGNLKRLLLRLAIDDGKISQLLASPGGDEWRDDEIVRQLKDHLLNAYDIVLETIEDMGRAAEELKKEMAANEDSLQQRIQQAKSPELTTRLKEAFKKPAATRKYHVYRLQFTLGEQVRNNLFKDMQRYNDRLRNLLDTGDAVSQIQSIRNAAKQTMMRSTVCGFWKHADRLYRVLCKAWNCSCWQQHHAHLLLQDRVSPEPHFQFMFWSAPPHLPPSSDSWFCRPARVEICDEPEPAVPIRFGPEPKPASSQHRTAAPLKSSLASGRHSGTKANIKFDSGIITVSHIQGVSSGSKDTPKSSQTEQDNQISSLCLSLRHELPTASCYGYIQARDKRYYIYQAEATIPAANSEPASTMTTLEAMLRSNTPTPLTRRQRYSLAVTLASSFLQLAGTPWIKSRWTKTDVVFFRGPQDSSRNTNTFFLDRPFICRNFQIPTHDQAPNSEDTIRGFESLGIILLELCFGKPIELHPGYRHAGAAASGTGAGAGSSAVAGFVLLVALDWLQDVTEEAGLEYADAVAWCLVGGRTLASSGEGWRTVMLERVVKLLGQCYSCIAAAPLLVGR
ncbi:hypothetical protein B0I37DRAFT_369530 [Chaetomium sp. MPI-CAGE-AT-0009]|nr:hypothetical protein B0I37DRAFT_369530 [Chaetomium sp. MPI-CAGE-AT-0009]